MGTPSTSERFVMVSKHVFITRFGIGILHEGWLIERMKLLEATVLPSLICQSEKNFEWWVAIGNDMPFSSRSMLEQLLAVDKRFCTVEVDHLRNGMIPVQKLKKEFQVHGSLISSRIDDDDLLHKHTVSEIQESAMRLNRSSSVSAIIYHPKGFELHVPTRELRELELHGPSMGLSASICGDRFIHAYSLHHMRIDKYCTEQNICKLSIPIDRQSWVYVRHVLGDSARGGQAQISTSHATALSAETMEFLNKNFGLDIDKFLLCIAGHNTLAPRVIGPKRTLLDERIQVMREISDLLRRIDSSEAQDPDLVRRKDDLYSKYVELSRSVFM